MTKLVATRIAPRQARCLSRLAGGAVGIAAIYSNSFVSIASQSLTASIVTMPVFGALTMYVMSMASLFRLRHKEPSMERPYRAPFYPIAPAVALALAFVALSATVYYNLQIALIFAVLITVAVAIAVLASRFCSGTTFERPAS